MIRLSREFERDRKLGTETPAERRIDLKHVVALVVDGNHVVAVDGRGLGGVLDGAVLGEQLDLDDLVVDLRVRLDEPAAANHFVGERTAAAHEHRHHRYKHSMMTSHLDLLFFIPFLMVVCFCCFSFSSSC